MKWSKDVIAEKLLTDRKWLERGIVALYERQTKTEQSSGVTKEENGVGFNKVDAAFLSSLAEKIQQGWQLSEKQLFIARKKMKKYSGQLARIANSKVVSQ